MKYVFKISRKSAVEIISALFILLFLYTAVTKSFDVTSTATVIRRTGVFSKYARETAIGIILIEYVIATLLFLPKLRKLGLYCSFALMTIFTAYISYMMLVMPHLPCSCGGVISKLSWTQHLIFNSFFIFLATIAILLDRKRDKDKSEEIETEQAIFT